MPANGVLHWQSSSMRATYLRVPAQCAGHRSFVLAGERPESAGTPTRRSLSDKRLRVRRSSALRTLNSKDEEAVAAAALQLRVGCALAALGHAQGDAWSACSARG